MINISLFTDRIVTMLEQYHIASLAAKHMSESSDALTAYSRAKARELHDFLSISKHKEVFNNTKLATESLSETSDRLKVKAARSLADYQSTLRQYTLVLLYSAWEAFLKDAIRELLRQYPSLLKEDRTIPLGKLVSKGEKAVLYDEVEREIDALDRKEIGARLNHISSVYGLVEAFDPARISVFKRSSEQRNQILHHSSRPSIKEHTLNQLAIAATIAANRLGKVIKKKFPKARILMG